MANIQRAIFMDGYDYHYIVALDKATGKTVWKTDRSINYGTDNGDLMKSFATPRVIQAAGKTQLISPSSMLTALASLIA